MNASLTSFLVFAGIFVVSAAVFAHQAKNLSREIESTSDFWMLWLIASAVIGFVTGSGCLLYLVAAALHV